jgi:hypothetical protein
MYPNKTTAEILFLTVNFGVLEIYCDMSVARMNMSMEAEKYASVT